VLTREDVEKQAWIGEQRAAVMELVEMLKSCKARIDYFERYLRAAGVLGSFIDDATYAAHLAESGSYLSCQLRIEIAQKLCEGTSMKVTP
jgi:hypothetical protein